MKKSGCTQIYWGLDAVSPSVLEYIQKGIDIKNVNRILKDSANSGIYNNVYIILGHPTETVEDIKKTFAFLSKNKNFIEHLLVIPNVLFLDGSKLYEEKEKYSCLIKTTGEQRYKLKLEIEKRSNNSTNAALFELNACGLLYTSKYSISSFHWIIRLSFFFFKNQLCYKLYISLCKTYIKFFNL